jgi:hypothetical protein
MSGSGIGETKQSDNFHPLDQNYVQTNFDGLIGKKVEIKFGSGMRVTAIIQNYENPKDKNPKDKNPTYSNSDGRVFYYKEGKDGETKKLEFGSSELKPGTELEIRVITEGGRKRRRRRKTRKTRKRKTHKRKRKHHTRKNRRRKNKRHTRKKN